VRIFPKKKKPLAQRTLFGGERKFPAVPPHFPFFAATVFAFARQGRALPIQAKNSACSQGLYADIYQSGLWITATPSRPTRATRLLSTLRSRVIFNGLPRPAFTLPARCTGEKPPTPPVIALRARLFFNYSRLRSFCQEILNFLLH
jgi:hypothetical protein